MTSKVGKIEKTLDVATRITSDFSGFHVVDTLSRRLAAITSFDKLARHATGKLKLSPADIKRYRNIKIFKHPGIIKLLICGTI